MKLEGEAAEWYKKGYDDATTGKPPRCTLNGEIPQEHGHDYNVGYRAGGGPWGYVFNGKPDTPRGA